MSNPSRRDDPSGYRRMTAFKALERSALDLERRLNQQRLANFLMYRIYATDEEISSMPFKQIIGIIFLIFLGFIIYGVLNS